jgi:hypothetical protein
VGREVLPDPGVAPAGAVVLVVEPMPGASTGLYVPV